MFRVHVEDAERFAKWLGGSRGRLPSARQWDKAAGRDRWQFEGPFDRPFADIVNNSTTDVLIAYDRAVEGPMPVGAAIADISRFGCRDMAGNGMEWTRTSAINETHSSVLDFQGEDVMLRGGPYRHGLPHTFEVENPEEYDFVSPQISFRVVLEVMTGSSPE